MDHTPKMDMHGWWEKGEQAVQGNIDTPAPRLPPAHLDGVMGVRSFPMVWITRLPHTQRPVQIPTPP